MNLQAKLSELVPNIPHTHICIHESLIFISLKPQREKTFEIFSAIFWWLSFNYYKYKLNTDL